MQVFLHGELGSFDEIGAGIAVSLVLLVDGLLVLTIWRSLATQRTKVLWTIAVFFLHVAAWVAFGIARSIGKLPPRVPPA